MILSKKIDDPVDQKDEDRTAKTECEQSARRTRLQLLSGNRHWRNRELGHHGCRQVVGENQQIRDGGNAQEEHEVPPIQREGSVENLAE